jgi:3-deoxy-D-manno-octulosonate 8-phosphate phosphatase (KDO 8-P phosphatase)
MTSKQSPSLTERAKQVKMIVLDVDGVLTNGLMYFGQEGESLKAFHVHDGLGITLAHHAGIQTAIITGRTSEMVRLRAAELKIGDLYQGTLTKITALQQLLVKYTLTLSQICYVGDDLNDLPLLEQVGLACAVANAVDEVKAVSHFTTSLPGGAGAVRQVIEMILKSQGQWKATVAAYQQAECSDQSQ